MQISRLTSKFLPALLLSSLLLSAAPAAFAQPKAAAQPIAVPAAPPSEDELAATREQMIALLRMSPTLTQVVETDPTILADQDYIARVNPQLGQYLAQHPEVVRNPDFYLFADIPGERGRRSDSLHHRDGNNEPQSEEEQHREFLLRFMPFVLFAVIIAALLWLIRILLENRRWGRVFHLQSDVHSKLIDRFASNQELLHYMETEPGKRFLEAAPIPVAIDRNQPLPGGLARVLGSLQIGIVLTLLGIGVLILQHSLPDMADALLIFGVVTLMPGLGFIISAIVAWRISARLGLMPQQSATPSDQPSGQQ
jgi:hypothetical protein